MKIIGLNSMTGRLVATLVLFLSLLLISLTVAAVRVRTMSDCLTQMNAINSVKQRQAINFRGSVHDRSILVRDLVLFEDEREISAAVSEIRQLERAYTDSAEDLDALMEAHPASDEEKAYERIRTIERQTLPLIETIVSKASAGVRDAEQEAALALARPLFVDWLAAINVYIDLEESKNKALGSTVSGIATSFTSLMIGLGLGALVLGGAAGYAMVRLIARRIAVIEAGMSSVTAGGVTDLRVRLDESAGDEFSRIASACNRVLSKLAETVRAVADASSSVRSSSSEVATRSSQIEDGTNRQLARTEQVAAAVEEMSASIGQLAELGSSASEASRRSEACANDGGLVVRRVIEQMQTISQHVSDSARQVTELGSMGESIGQVIAVINGIADQTNLLALNAAIEAARAGEHGRGFAVVADEVRKLAERTQSATEEVSRSIRDIQDATRSAGARMEASTEGVGAGVELVASAGTALDGILGESASVLSMTQSMAHMTDQQAAASADISQSVIQIQDLCSEVARSASGVSSASSHLVERAEGLDSLVRQFRF